MKRFDQRYIKKKNQGRILQLLYAKGPKSRAQISREIGIVPSTVSEITGFFLRHGIIFEGSKVTGKIGKRPQLLHFQNSYYFFLCVVISGIETDIGLCNLQGEILKEEHITYSESASAQQILALCFQSADRLLLDIDKHKLVLISLGSPETVNRKTGEIKWSPYIQDWVGTDLAAQFREKYKTHVILKDHVKLETLGEHWKNFNRVINLVYIVITRGIGSGVVIDGQIREGENGYLGEIAYLPIGECANYEQLRLERTGLGHFEAQCDILHIEKIVNEHYKDRRPNLERILFREIAQRYQSDRELRELINGRILETLAMGIASVIIVLDPEVVVINGEITEFGDAFLQNLKSLIFSIIPYRTNILYSNLGKRARLFGAIKHGLDYLIDALVQDPEDFFQIAMSDEKAEALGDGQMRNRS